MPSAAARGDAGQRHAHQRILLQREPAVGAHRVHGGAPLPHTTTNRFKITDDLGKAYANIAARANDLRVTKPAEDGGSKVMLLPLVSETLASQGASILAPPPGSGEARVLALNKNVPAMLAQGYTVLADASEMYIPDADDTEAGAIPVGPPELNIPRMREHWPSLDCGGDVADKLVLVWEDGYTVGKQSFSPLRMWDESKTKLDI